MTGKRWFWLAVALQVALLLGMAGRHAYTVSTGAPALLKTEPVDPWDFFRGEYVRLNYEISRLDPTEVTMNGPFKAGQTVWVTLQQGTPYWTATAVSTQRPAAAANQILLKGTVESVYEPVAEPWPGAPKPGEIRIRYGFEQFYVPEGQGSGLEQRQVDLSVEIKVDGFGRGALSKVFLAGKEITWN